MVRNRSSSTSFVPQRFQATAASARHVTYDFSQTMLDTFTTCGKDPGRRIPTPECAMVVDRINPTTDRRSNYTQGSTTYADSSDYTKTLGTARRARNRDPGSALFVTPERQRLFLRYTFAENRLFSSGSQWWRYRDSMPLVKWETGHAEKPRRLLQR